MSVIPWISATDGSGALHAFVSAMVDSFPVACFVIDAGHKVVYWSRGCEILTGVPAGEIVGSSGHGQVFTRADRYVIADIALLGQRDARVGELYAAKYRPSTQLPGTLETAEFFPHFGDAGRWLYLTAAPLYGPDGDLLGAIQTLQDVSKRRNSELALKANERRFRRLSAVDNLTRLYNARHFDLVLKKEIARSRRHGQPLALMVFDVDNFKRINDTYGHQEGDRLLRLVAEELRAWKRETDYAFRLGGDEFSAILPATDLHSARSAAERLVARWNALAAKGDERSSKGCTFSVGVTEYDLGESRHELVRRADMAAYDAKRRGRNRVVIQEKPEAARSTFSVRERPEG